MTNVLFAGLGKLVIFGMPKNNNMKPANYLQTIFKFICLIAALQFMPSSARAGDDFLGCLKDDNQPKNGTLVILYRNDCPWCRQMDQVISGDPQIQQELKNRYRIYVLEINSADGKLFAASKHINKVPTLVAFDGNSGEEKIINGFGNSERLRSLLGFTEPLIFRPKNDGLCEMPVYTNNFRAQLSVCGDGLIEGSEECDDGNTNNGDGCSSTCTQQPGWMCIGLNPSICFLPICGDGIKTPNEQCDDNNLQNGDGCTNTCSTEPGWACTGNQPSICTLLPVCGNGILESGEQCDDNNTTNGDGCSSTCTLENGPGGILIKNGGGQVDISAMMDINSTQRGLLIPRMTTTQRLAIGGPATGLMVFDNTTNSFWFYGGSSWREIKSDANNSSFRATIPATSQTASPSAPVIVLFANEIFDEGGDNYNPATGAYTVTASGVYGFNAYTRINIVVPIATATTYAIAINEYNGATVVQEIGVSQVPVPANFTGAIILQASGTTRLSPAAGRTVKVAITASSNIGTNNIPAGGFSGQRVY